MTTIPDAEVYPSQRFQLECLFDKGYHFWQKDGEDSPILRYHFVNNKEGNSNGYRKEIQAD